MKVKAPSDVLIMADGDVPSLVALAAAREAFLSSKEPPTRAAAAWAWSALSETSVPRRRAVEAQAKALGLVFVEGALDALTRAHAFPGEQESAAILAAGFDAARQGRSQIIWPAVAGGDGGVERVARVSDKATLLTRLLGLDSPQHGVASIRIEAPMADLSDRQVADLAAELGVPVQLCWWWTQGNTAAGASVEAKALADAARRRWEPLLQGAGWKPKGRVV